MILMAIPQARVATLHSEVNLGFKKKAKTISAFAVSFITVFNIDVHIYWN